MISIIIPTYNEKDNLEPLLQGIFSALGSYPGEVVIVDDNSPDGTGAKAEELKQRFPMQVIHRSGKNGLASAVIEGIQSTQSNYLCIMDADLSHDASILAEMTQWLEKGSELVIGSRYVPGGGTKNWPKIREFGSRFAISLARPITLVRDATSGYFCFKRKIIEGVKLDPLGFKIGLEIFVKGNYSSFKEVPFVFQDRLAGESKLNQKEVLNYLKHLTRLYKWKLLNFFANQKNTNHN